MKKKFRINGKQIKLLINVISLAIFCVSYFYLYDQYVDKTESAYKEVELVKAQIKDRQEKLSEEDEVSRKIPEVREQKQAIIDHFPANIKDEDNFMFIEQMEKALNIKTSSVTMSENSLFFDTELPAVLNQEIAADQQVTNITAVVNNLSMSFVTDYNGFKQLAEYIRKYPENTSINSVVVSYDSSSGSLTGNLSLNRYALLGTGREYEEPSIDGIDIGTDNIFGTGSKKNNTTEPEPGIELQETP